MVDITDLDAEEPTEFPIEEDPDTDKRFSMNMAGFESLNNSPAKPIVDQQKQESAQKQQLAQDAQDNEFVTEDDNVFTAMGDVANFVGNIGIGAVKGVEEVGQFVRVLEDDAFNLPPPETIAEGIAQGIGQFLPSFLTAGAGITKGFKLFNMFQGAKGLTKAGAITKTLTAGAVADVTAFDPKDPNAGNLLLHADMIGNNPVLAAGVKKYLAQQDEDSEAIARSKNALTGMMAGLLFDGIIKGGAAGIKGLKGLKQATEESAQGFTDVLEHTRQAASPQEKKILIDKLPDEVVGVTKQLEKEKIESAQAKMVETTPEGKTIVNPEVTRMLTQVAKDGDFSSISKQDLNVIESFNLTKLDTTEGMKNAIQAISKTLDIQKLHKPSIADQDFDTVIAELLDPSGSIKPIDMQFQIDKIKEVVSNVDEAIKYVGSVKVLTAVSLDDSLAKMVKLSQTITETGPHSNATRLARKNAEAAQGQLEEVTAQGGLLSKKSSDLLRSHKKKVKALDDPRVLQGHLASDILRTPDDVAVRVGPFNKIVDDALTPIKSEAKATTEVAGRKVKTTVSKTETPTGKKIVSQVKRLQNTLKALKAGKTAAPTKAKIPDTPEVANLKAEIKKVRGERDVLAKAEAKEFKEILSLRKDFERKSKKIRDLQAGKKKSGVSQAKKERTDVEIQQLDLEIQRLRTAFQKKEAGSVAKQVAQKRSLLNRLIKRRIRGDHAPVTKAEKTELIKDLESQIKEQKKLINERVTREELEAQARKTATTQELAGLSDLSLQKLKTRILFRNKSFAAKSMDTLLEIYINGLLSSVKTFEVNAFGNTSAIGSSIIERAYAGVTKGDDIAFKEASTLAWNYISGIPDALRMFKKALSQGPEDGAFKTDFHKPFERSLSSEAWNVTGSMGRAIDFMGTVVNVPGKLMISADEGFKALNMRAETRALAYRKARSEVGGDLSTPEAKLAITKRMTEILDNIGEHPDISEGAKDFARKNTFTNPLEDIIDKDPLTGKERVRPGISKLVKQGIDNHGFLKVFVPFFTTPLNLFKFSVARTPVLRRFSRELQDNLKGINGPANKRLAEARVATSNILWTGLFGLAYTGNFTGSPPRDPNLRKTMEAEMDGNHWNTISFGDGTRIKYDRLDPFGVMLESAASLAVMAKHLVSLSGRAATEGDPSGLIEEKMQEVLVSGVIGVAQAIKDRHFIKGIAEIVDFISGDPQGLKPSLRRLTSVVPTVSLYSSLRRNVTNALEPEKLRKLQRNPEKTDSFAENTLSTIMTEISAAYEEGLRSVTPGYGDRIPEKNLVGEVVFAPGLNGEMDFTQRLSTSLANPTNPTKKKDSPLLNALARLESNIEQPSSIHGRGSIIYTEEEKSFIIDTWTDLNKKIAVPLVKSKSFEKLPDGLQKLLLENVIKEAKKNALDASLVKFPRLREGVIEDKKKEIFSQTIKEQPQGFQTP